MLDATPGRDLLRRANATNLLLRRIAKALSVVVVGSMFGHHASPASAAEPAPEPRWLSAPNGMTLYVYDGDRPYESRCRDWCRAARPVYQPAQARLAPGYDIIVRPDGLLQVALQGRPLYFYAGDSAPGDALGDDAARAWHAVPAPRVWAGAI